MNEWLVFWLLWGAVGLAVELVAVFNRKAGDTLSEQVWRVLLKRGAIAAGSRVVVAGGLMWLLGHFTGWWA